MTPVTEHPLRCETCEKKNCQIIIIDADSGHEVIFNPRESIEKTLWFVQGIKQVGCASHSASDKVLDEKKAFLDKVARRVREEFTLCDDDEYYLGAEQFEDVLDELTQGIEDEKELRQQHKEHP